MATPNENAKPSWMLTLASVAVVIAALYLAKGVLVPLTLALLLSFLLSPVCNWLERWSLGRIPAVLVTAFLGFTVLGGVVWTAAVQMKHLAPKIPEYQRNIEAKLDSVNEYAAAAVSNLTRTAQGMGQKHFPSEPTSVPTGTNELPFVVRVLSSPVSPLQVFGGVFGTLIEVLGTTGIVIVLVVFFLIQREDLRDRFIHLVGKGHVTVTTQMLGDAGARVSRYLSMLFLVNVTFGISVGIGLYLIGVPNAVLWGILATALRFIPYIGPWIAAAMPIGLSLAISTGWLATFLTIGLFTVLEFFNNHVLEPWLYGKKTGVSAVAVLVAAVFWMWLWGPVGLLLATPLTVCVLVVGKHVPQLFFLDILLGTEPVFEPQERIFQRLLAGDPEEAAELFEEYLQHKPLIEVYDSVLIPALALAETHWQLGELNEAKHVFIMQSLKEMIQDHGERQREMLAKEPTPIAPNVNGHSTRVDDSHSPPVSILCLPARDEADEIAATMIAQVLESSGCQVQAVSIMSLASELVDLVDQSTADVICVSATPPAAVMHARYLCKRLRGQLPQVKLIVGLWNAQGDLNKAKERIGCGAIVFATLAEAQQQIQLFQAQMPLSEKETQPHSGPMAMAGA
jgi:predicted PurR-regulated permease PerM/methylmalonyl-CoA mutase cobalamin-binding subunit